MQQNRYFRADFATLAECRTDGRCSTRRGSLLRRDRFVVTLIVPSQFRQRQKIPRSSERKIPMRYLHTMVRVSDLDQSLSFYCEKLGLRELRRHDNDKGRY